ncbi:MAG: type II secretion system protein [Patescibacteria group bacterium]
MTNQKGFTLIELLVVVAIIGILSGIAFVSISGARESAYDTQIKSELSQVRSSAEMFYYDNGGTYGGNVTGVTAYNESSNWNRIAGELPLCAAAKHDSLGYAEPNTYQVEVDNQKYLAWAALCTNANEQGDTHWYCIDSNGNALETQLDPAVEANRRNAYECPEAI